MYEKITKELLSFIDRNPGSFHAIASMEEELEKAGYIRLPESEVREIRPGGKYYADRNGSSMIAFRVPEGPLRSFRIAAAHTDSPSFRIKGLRAQMTEGAYLKLDVEPYGGMIMSTWLDRPLSLAGRVFVNASAAGGQVPAGSYVVPGSTSQAGNTAAPAGAPAGGYIVPGSRDIPADALAAAAGDIPADAQDAADRAVPADAQNAAERAVPAGADIPSGSQLREIRINIDRDLLLIPSVAIHMNRDANKGTAWDPQKDLLPLFGMAKAKASASAGGSGANPANNSKNSGTAFENLIAEAAGVSKEDILSCDLFLYPRTRGCIWGADNEFFSARHIDNLQCVYASFRAFLDTDPGKGSRKAPAGVMPVLAFFDSEEVGSRTRQGAASTFLEDILTRICEALSMSHREMLAAIAGSFMVSADNAHAVHPNHPEYHDPVYHPVINGGIVIKYAASQRYATDARSAAVFRQICGRAGVPCQEFYNRSGIPGGSTLGNIVNTHISLSTVDIGLPQLAMHSAFETAGVLDTEYLARAMYEYFR